MRPVATAVQAAGGSQEILFQAPSVQTVKNYPTDDVIFALFDGDYHLGLGALVNSLYKAGFRGLIYAGHRGPVPAWAGTKEETADLHQFEIGESCAVRFVKIDFAGHLTNYKPDFVQRVLRTHAKEARRIFYFDVDIVVKAPWQFFQDWVSCGIAVCRDLIDPYMSANHPVRMHWRRFASDLGFECRHVDGYFSGGFLGLSVEQAGFLETWQSFMRRLEQSGVSVAQLREGQRPSATVFLDQDMLNAALMTTPFPIAPVENSGMDFAPGGYVMSHAVGRAKPWRRRYILDALLGYPPDQAHKLYWRTVSDPVALFSPGRRAMAVCSLNIAAAIGRIYSRH